MNQFDLHSPAATAAPFHQRAGRNILVLEFDVFGATGGGQTVYQQIIRQRSDDTFYYFLRNEPADWPRPSNAIALPFLEAWCGRGHRVARGLQSMVGDYVLCRNLAASVRHYGGPAAFDVVDVPDFRPIGAFVRSAFAEEGIQIGVLALALHGTLSDAFRLGWPSDDGERRILAELRVRERLQFRVADVRYAISQRYAGRWNRIAAHPINMLDPLCMVDRTEPLAAPPGSAPDLTFFGRREKWKGPDLFLDIAWCLDPAAYQRIVLVGPDGPNRIGVGSQSVIDAMARVRHLQPEILARIPRSEIMAMFGSRNLLLLPSRYDTFNLIALEAVMAGCPTIVSTRAGIADWLTDQFPELPWLCIDIDCSRQSAANVETVLRDYDRHREALLESLARRSLRPDETAFHDIYRPANDTDLQARQTAVELASALTGTIEAVQEGLVRSIMREPRRLVGSTIRTAQRAALPPVRRSWKRLPVGVRESAWHVRNSLRTGLTVLRHGPRHPKSVSALKVQIRAGTHLSPRAFSQVMAARHASDIHRRILAERPRTAKDVDGKLRWLSSIVSDRLIDRVTLFREMAQLERRRGNDLIAATYLLRTMRWLGRDARGDLPYVASCLRDLGYDPEAEAAEAMFGSDPDARSRCLGLMHDALDRNRTKPELPLARREDFRGAIQPRVSVIASLYNAATKLPTLLTMLANQSLARRGELEVVLVDSNSPSDEYAALEAFLSTRSLPVLYVRSAERETIQAAWNRGIHLSRAPYLAFLGADEGLHPDALSILANELDSQPDVDWAMADSVVTNVDRDGVFDSDVMPYDRTGYRQDLVYLDTTYLSWVGGLYRRTLHDRYGWYDDSYRAAGDTEFKNRLLPFIRSVHVPQLLGVFNNYPEERTTASPRAELEDLRAWYLWRTPAGMDYAFGHRPATDAIELFKTSLRYRKAFCGHISSDFDLAHSVATHLAGRQDAGALGADSLRAMDETMQFMHSLEIWQLPVQRDPGRLRGAAWMLGAMRRLRQMAVRHRAEFGLGDAPDYEAFNDNRYEQHWWSWTTV